LDCKADIARNVVFMAPSAWLLLAHRRPEQRGGAGRFAPKQHSLSGMVIAKKALLRAAAGVRLEVSEETQGHDRKVTY